MLPRLLIVVAIVSLRTTGTAADVVSEFHDIVVQFAPRLRFDSQTGNQMKQCLPDSAERYYNSRKVGNTGLICNLDYTTILDGRVPSYYQVALCENNDLYISYWTFFGYKDDCPLEPGNKGGDVNWGRYVVKVLNSTYLDRVIFYQHDGWYTRNPGRYEVADSTHPVAYLGKLRQGHYHDDGGSGTCCYFEDYRNPGSQDKHFDTWRNMLIWLRNDETSPEWMTNNEPFYWNGVTLPHFRAQDLCNLRGCAGSHLQVCGTCGCHKSDVDDNERP